MHFYIYREYGYATWIILDEMIDIIDNNDMIMIDDMILNDWSK